MLKVDFWPFFPARRFTFMTTKFPAAICSLFLLTAAVALGADRDVIINEVMYHPPEQLEELQYIELFNRSSNSVSLENWAFTKGVRFTFPKGSNLGPGEFLVVTRNATALKKTYGAIPIVGDFSGKLSHKKDRLELVSSGKELVDWVEYQDHGEWPAAPDGYSSSLERISPSDPSELPENWASSRLPAFVSLGGTPGKRNDSFLPKLPPRVSHVVFSTHQPKPLERVRLSCEIAHPTGVKESVVFWNVFGGATVSTNSLPLKRVSGDERSGKYEVEIPGQNLGKLLRLVIKATGSEGEVRVSPNPFEPRPSFSLFYHTNRASTFVSQGILLQTGPTEERGSSGPGSRRSSSVQRREPVRGNGAFVYFSEKRQGWELFDHIRITPRKAGMKVRFLNDQKLNGMSTVNLVLEQAPRFLLAEHLAYEIYRLAGVPTPYSEHIRLNRNGREHGLYLLIEQPNRSFLTRNGRDDSGNLYKLLWYGNGVVEQHEKKTNTRLGHGDLVSLIEGLNSRNGAAQWDFIEKNFNVEECINYFVVNMCIQNWDGFFNNYFTYHDAGGSKKWEIYPWDEDKTWGDYDGASPSYDWYQLPLTYGMKGDRSPSRSSSLFNFGGRNQNGPFGEMGWWRPPGYFSGPLLANLEFRKRFLLRLKEFTEQSFTEQKVAPLIDSMEKRLLPEIQFKAGNRGDGRSQQVVEFKAHMESFRRQLVERRRFILSELRRMP